MSNDQWYIGQEENGNRPVLELMDDEIERNRET